MNQSFRLRFRFRAAILFAMVITSVPAQGAPKTWIDRTQAEFGRVSRGDTVTEQFRLKNLGDEVLRIERADVSMPGMNIKVKQTIEPGEETPLTVSWDTTNHAQAVEGHVVLHLNDPKIRKITLALTGTVFGPIDVLPYPVVYLSTYAGEIRSRVLTIVNNQPEPLVINRVELRGDAFTAKIETKQKGQRYELIVSAKPDLPIGKYQQTLTLHTNSATRPKLGVPVNVLVKPDVYVTPDAVEFGAVRLGDLTDPQRAEFLSQTLTLTRKSGSMSITEVTSDLSQLVIVQDPSSNGVAFRFDVRLDPDMAAVGPLAGNIVIHTTDRANPRITIPVSGHVGH
jgi:hypothetical protein